MQEKGVATGGRGYSLETKPYEQGDPAKPWRVPLHPWDGGLRTDRIDVAVSGYTGEFFNKTPRSYAKGNCDASFPGLLLFPPALNTLTLTNSNANPPKIIEFNSLLFILSGRYMYTYNPSTNAIVEDKDFGSGKACVDAAVFNNELVVAMGESEKLYTRNTSATWTQATNNTFAIALGVVENKLWRAETTNRLSNCTTAPRTLASWTPASPNQYYAGDSTWAVNSIIDYGGVPWVGKGDGMYAPNPQLKWKNQTPQLQRYPLADNCKGTFVATGYLWVPSIAGLLRITPGKSKVMGPELTGRPDMHFFVRNGVEWGNAIYLVATDEDAVDNTVIIKMIPDQSGLSDHEYVYHEWARLGGTSASKAIAISALATNPKMVVGFGNNAKYIVLGRGSQRMIDDANYLYGTAMELETGPFVPSGDLSVPANLVGISVLLNYSDDDETLICQFRKDGETSWQNLLDSQDEAGGVIKINGTDRYETVRRYAPPGTQGQFFEVKMTGAQASGAGTTRPEIREVWAHGFIHPKQTDFVTITIPTGRNIKVNGRAVGASRSKVLNWLRGWADKGIELKVELPDYEESRPTRFFVREVQETEINATPGAGHGSDTASLVKVLLVRADHSGGYAE